MAQPNVCINKDTSAASTDGGGAVPKIHQDNTAEAPTKSQDPTEKTWYILWVRSKAEKAVRKSLIRDGIEAFVATVHETHVWRRGQRRRIEKVLIPSVVFVRMTKAERQYVERRPGVVSLMYDPARKKDGKSGWDTLARVCDEDMQLFRQMLMQEDLDVSFTSADFTIGEHVRIKDFDQAYSTAQIVRIFGDTRTYIGLRVSFLGCAYMQLPLDRITKL